MRYFVLSACAVFAACAAPVHVSQVREADPCNAAATRIIAQNADLIVAHRYAQASGIAERAARISLGCSRHARADAVFADRWRGANALVVAAELAHEAHQPARARELLHEGYAIMHSLRPPRRVNELTSTLLAQKLGTARQDLAGQWAYW